MAKNYWSFDKNDEKAAKEIRDFLPEKMYDIHAHIYEKKNAKGLLFQEAPGDVTISLYKKFMERQIGKNKLKGGLFLSLPEAKNLDAMNDFTVEELKKAPLSRGSICITPKSNKAKVLEYLKNKQVTGFKVYHYFSNIKPTWNATIRSYIPEWAWEMANERKLVITLHMVREKAVSDPENLKDIIKMCTKYPNAKLVLAHAARCFCYHNSAGLKKLRGLENLWFDTAAICESAPITAILNEFGPKKLLWGSDFPVTEERGRCVTIGDTFLWVDVTTVNWEKSRTSCKPVLVGLESLRALKKASDEFGLNAEDINDIFFNNAMQLLGIKKQKGNLTQDLYKYAKYHIPAGTQLFSKRPETMAPDIWPVYFTEARGCETWDLDGKHYYDMSSNGISSCLLGFCDPDVLRAVKRRINLGNMSTLNPPEEVELTKKLLKMHKWAGNVRFGRMGGETMAIAVRIARATTDRSVVAVCGYHGWHDWYLAANLGADDALRGHLLPGLNPLGVPRELRGTNFPFTYGKKEEFLKIVNEHGRNLAAVVMEICRSKEPDMEFLEFVKEETKKCGALLIIDEISIGFRLALGGAHLRYKINPDMAVYAKSLGNGYPIGAVVGTKEAMDGAHSSFISSTYWTESIGPTAALAVLKKMEEINVPAFVARAGEKVKEYWRRNAQKYNLPITIDTGFPCFANFKFNHELADELRTLFIQLMLEEGFLSNITVSLTLAHKDDILAKYNEAIDKVFCKLSKIISEGKIKESLKGPVAHKGFRRLI